jgi:hypothetical protein
VNAHFTVDACFENDDSTSKENNNNNKASGYFYSGYVDYAPDDLYIYQVQCMHVTDDNKIYLGTQIKRLTYAEKESAKIEKKMEEELGGEGHGRRRFLNGIRKLFGFGVPPVGGLCAYCPFAGCGPPEELPIPPEKPPTTGEPRRGLTRHDLMKYDDFYSPDGRRYLVEANNEDGEEATMAIFYLQSANKKDGDDETCTNQVAVKLHEKYDPTCAGFDELVGELDFSEVTDKLTTGEITIA